MEPHEVRRTPCPAPTVAPGGTGLGVEDQAGRSAGASEQPLAPVPTALRMQGSEPPRDLGPCLPALPRPRASPAASAHLQWKCVVFCP